MNRHDPPFDMGKIVVTPAAMTALLQSGEDVATYLDRHVCCDWGDIDAEDAALNNEALVSGARLFSAYTLKDRRTRLWIITEAVGDDGCRASTCILTPSDY